MVYKMTPEKLIKMIEESNKQIEERLRVALIRAIRISSLIVLGVFIIIITVGLSI